MARKVMQSLLTAYFYKLKTIGTNLVNTDLIGDFIFFTECSENSEKSRCSTPDAANTCYINIIFSLFHTISHRIAEKNE
jgi:hypothetical protein